MSITKLPSKNQDSVFRGALSFVSGVSTGENTHAESPSFGTSQSEEELSQLQQDLLILIGELEEFVLDEGL